MRTRSELRWTRWKTAATASAAGLVVSLAASHAHALELESRRSPDASACPAADEVRTTIAERLGRDPFSAGGRAGRVSVDFARSAPGYSARIDIEAEGEPRVVRTVASVGADCRVVAATVATTVAIMLEAPPGEAPAFEQGTSAPSSQPSLQPPVPAERSEDAPPDLAPPAGPTASDAKRRVDGSVWSGWFVGAGATTSFGSAPAPAVGFAAWAGHRFGALSVRLFGRVDLPSTGEGEGGLRVRTQTRGVGVAPCLHVGRVEACPVAAVMLVGAEGGDNVRAARRDEQTIGAVGARVAALLSLSRAVALAVSADALAPLPPAHAQAGAVEAWSMSPVLLTLGAGAQIR